MQQRLPKYRRTDDSLAALSHRQITDRSLEIISFLSFYHILPTSLLVKLVEGNEDITCRHLQTLYHRRLINRFSFPSVINPGEFHYYIDHPAALELLTDAGWAEPHDLNFDRVRYDRDKKYDQIHFDGERQGSLLYLKHEAMISRFHTLLELACRTTKGKVELIDWRQGPELWHSVIVPKVAFDNQRDLWGEQKETERLPHRPDAFFTLRFTDRPEGDQDSHFFYEADRKTTTDRKRIIKKLRAHFHYIVKQKRHETDYQINRIRAVLVETIDDHWAMRLREVGSHPIVSGPKPSPLFWFTTSRLFEHGPEQEQIDTQSKGTYFLKQPEIIFHGVWATPAGETLHSLLD